jgi:signal transduction histidine kinase
MIDSLLEFSKSNVLEKKTIPRLVLLCCMRKSLLFCIQNNCNITFKANVDLLNDKSAIEQILINLMLNAIKRRTKTAQRHRPNFLSR